jgi:tetratricopeptide (TPR) repeat protein
MMISQLTRAVAALTTPLIGAMFVSMFVSMPARASSTDDWKDCIGGDADRRIAGCTRIIENGIGSPSRAVAYTNRGLAYRVKGDIDRAIADYTEAIRLQPRNALAYNNRGSAYTYVGDFDRAIEDYTEAIRFNAVPPAVGARLNVYYNRGFAYAQKGDSDRAVADFTEAISRAPQSALSYSMRGIVYLAGGAVAKAAADFKQAKTAMIVLTAQWPTGTAALPIV